MAERRQVRFDLDEFQNAEYYYRQSLGEYVEADDDFDILDETAKDVLSEIMTSIEETEEDKISETKLERLARADPKWKEFRRGIPNSMTSEKRRIDR